MEIGWFGVGSGGLASPGGVGGVARRAEELGFESVWIGEHPVLIDPQAPPSPLAPESDLFDPVPTLAYAAAVTGRIKLGTGIVILPLRNPVILAKQLATVDVLSEGRLIFGVGIGYVPGEYEAVGVPFGTRGRRADEYIDAIRAVWRDDRPAYQGEFAGFSGIQCRPQPAQRPGPPILASGMSTAARRRAIARCDGWYGFFLGLDATAAAIRELDRLATEIDRPPELRPFEITITPPAGEIDTDTVERYEELGVDRLVLVRDFRDMSGGPDSATHAAVLAELERTANELKL